MLVYLGKVHENWLHFQDCRHELTQTYMYMYNPANSSASGVSEVRKDFR